MSHLLPGVSFSIKLTQPQRKTNKKQKSSVYFVGLAGELAAAKLALDLALGAVVLQVVGQVAARQLDGAAVGTRDHVEGAGGEVALRVEEKPATRSADLPHLLGTEVGE